MLITSLNSCSQKKKGTLKEVPYIESLKNHEYGGWHCPDNLRMFPPVDISEWNDVPVVSKRLPTKDEIEEGKSLILVDKEKYPEAEALDMDLPALARFQSPYTHREEIVLLIQAIRIDEDSIVGFRYPSGGNGSAYLSEVNLLTSSDITKWSKAKFVNQTIRINAPEEVVWETLISKAAAKDLEPFLDVANHKDWRESTNVNFFYPNKGDKTSVFADLLFGLHYIQNDYCCNGYTEKFLLYKNEEDLVTDLHMVCGPYSDDYAEQRGKIYRWAEAVKMISESTR